MKPRCRIGRLAVVVTASLAWFAISNHCAIGSLPAKQAAGHHGCHGEEPDNPEEPAGHDTPCCKTLAATPVSMLKASAAQLSTLPPLPFAILGTAAIPAAHDSGRTLTDTGPPGGNSFAESVLQRSLLAHAPPLVS